MEAAPASASAAQPPVLRRTRHVADRIGDTTLYVLTGLAAIVVMLVIAAIVWKVVEGAWPAMRHFGPAFIWHGTWNPVTEVFGARWFIVGTLVTSFGAIFFAAPLSIAIGLFLTELAPAAVRG